VNSKRSIIELAHGTHHHLENKQSSKMRSKKHSDE